MAGYNHLKGIPELPDSPNIKKKRPKSAYHSKFARPSTGVHSLKNKRKM